MASARGSGGGERHTDLQLVVGVGDSVGREVESVEDLGCAEEDAALLVQNDGGLVVVVAVEGPASWVAVGGRTGGSHAVGGDEHAPREVEGGDGEYFSSLLVRVSSVVEYRV